MSTFKGFFLFSPPSFFLLPYQSPWHLVCVNTATNWRGNVFKSQHLRMKTPSPLGSRNIHRRGCKVSPLWSHTKEKKEASRWVSGLCFQPLINKCRLARPGPKEVRLAQWSSASLWKSAPSENSTLLSVSPPHTLLWLAALAGAAGNFWCNTAPSGPECPCTHRHACTQMQRAPSVQLRTDAALGRQGQKRR